MENEENIVANVEMTGAQNEENNLQQPEVVVENIATTEPTQQEIAFAYLKENGIEANSIEDLKRVPEKIIEKVEVNPFEDILDEDDKAYFNYKKETKGSRADYEKAIANLDEIPKINLARELVRKEAGIDLTDEEADEFITDSLGVNLDYPSVSDNIKLAKYTKALLEEKKLEQAKYKTAKKEDIAITNSDSEYVTLDNKSVMRKADYEAMLQEQERQNQNRLETIEKAKVAANSVASTSFNISIDDNGTPINKSYSYNYSEDDKHSMVSMISDVSAVIEKEYGTGNDFNHKQFSEDMLWRSQKNREKMISSIIHQVRADAIEEILKNRGNVSLRPNDTLQQQNKEGVKTVPITNIFNR